MGPWNNVLDRGQDRTNSFVSMTDDKSEMRPFAKIVLILVSTACSRVNPASISAPSRAVRVFKRRVKSTRRERLIEACLHEMPTEIKMPRAE